MKLKELLQNLFSKKKSESVIENDDVTFLPTLLNYMHSPIFYKDINGIYRHCNTAFCKFLGLDMNDIIGHTVHDITSPKSASIYEEIDKEFLNDIDKHNYETKVKFNDGTTHDVLLNKTAVKDKSGKLIGVAGVILDITENKLNEKKLERFSRLKDAMLEVNNAVIGISDMNKLFNLILEKALECISVTSIGTILRIDDKNVLRVAAYKGYAPSVIENFSINLMDSFEWKLTNGNFKNSIIIDNLYKVIDKKLLVSESKNGNTINSIISSPILIDNKLYGFINLDSESKDVFDNTDVEIMDYMRHQIEIAIAKHKLYEEIITLSQYDELTGLYNRRYFEEQLRHYMLKTKKFDKEFFLILFDLNGLKHVNDEYGHIAGDKYISEFAKNLKKDLLSFDMAARIGGDEFIALFSRGNLNSLLEKLEKLNKYFEDNPLIYGKDNLTLSFSYGIANYPEDGVTYNELFKKADTEMYAYKRRAKQ